MSKNATSFSALNNFETCPKKFWHLRVQKDVREQEGEALRYGKKVHKALEHYVGKGTALPSEFQHLAKHVERFVHWPGTKHVEMEMAITEQYKPTGWFDKDVWIRAKLDLVIIGDRNAVLVDYKTGKMKDDGFTQLKLAAAMLMLHFRQILSIRMAYLWTEYDGEITHQMFERDQFVETWNELMPRLNHFEEAHKLNNFPANPSGLCRRHCPVTKCPHNGQA
jgi:hypothetical protein